MTCEDFLAINDFLGENITEEQRERLMDKAKRELSKSDLTFLLNKVCGPMYTELSTHNCEMGGLDRY